MVLILPIFLVFSDKRGEMVITKPFYNENKIGYQPLSH